MNWKLLKENKCPKCEKDFTKGLEVEEMIADFDKMLYHVCGFKIRETTYRRIVNSQITQELIDKWDREVGE